MPCHDACSLIPTKFSLNQVSSSCFSIQFVSQIRVYIHNETYADLFSESRVCACAN